MAIFGTGHKYWDKRENGIIPRESILTTQIFETVEIIPLRGFNFISRKLGASEGTINQEIQRYQQLESVAVNDIRRDVRKKLRRSSMRVSRIKLL